MRSITRRQFLKSSPAAALAGPFVAGQALAQNRAVSPGDHQGASPELAGESFAGAPCLGRPAPEVGGGHSRRDQSHLTAEFMAMNTFPCMAPLALWTW